MRRRTLAGSFLSLLRVRHLNKKRNLDKSAWHGALDQMTDEKADGTCSMRGREISSYVWRDGQSDGQL